MKCPDCGREISGDATSMAIRKGVGIVCSSCGCRIVHEALLNMVGRKLARRGHPETSAQAAQKFAPKRRETQLRALGFVLEHPGKTSNELAQIAEDRDPRKIGRRLPELVDMGLVKRGPACECSVTTHQATTWYPVEAKILVPQEAP